MAPAELARLLADAHEGPQYSVRAALALADGQPPPRVASLVSRLTASKRALWARIARAAGTPGPPDDAGLARLSAWEGDVVRGLTAGQLGTRLDGGETVEEALLEHVREMLWTAGMMGSYGEGVRMV